jgi:serine/threonine-protein kinase
MISSCLIADVIIMHLRVVQTGRFGQINRSKSGQAIVGTCVAQNVAEVREMEIGTLLEGRYRVKKRLGSGGMGTVYAAWDLVLEMDVAIKVGRDGASDIEMMRFLREARTMAGLDHANIARILDLGQLPEGRPYLVMELLRGKTFRELANEGPVDLDRIIDRLWEIASALDWIHQHRVIHRDLKLDNMMLVTRTDGTETAKLFDFGIALAKKSNLARLTHEGSIVGTPLYIAPEMVTADEATPRTDIYAFGIVIYQLLAGVAPFESISPVDLLRKKAAFDPPPLSRYRRDVPRGVEAAIARAIARKPGDRPRTARELIRLLANARHGGPAKQPQQHLALMGSLAFLLAILLSGYATFGTY